MYLNVTLTEDQKQKLQDKYNEFVDIIIKDNMEDMFRKTLEGYIKTFVHNQMATPEFKNKIVEKLLPLFKREMGI